MVWVDSGKIFAIIAVIVLHVSDNVVLGVGNFDSKQWWIGNIYNALVRWCVPVFVMLSGASLLSDDKDESIPEFYNKRSARLLIPILFWSIFFVGWTFWAEMVKGDAPSLLSVGKRSLLFSPYYHMWFLYMITGLYFVTPFIRILVKNTLRRYLLFLIIALFAISAFNNAYAILHTKKAVLFINWFLYYLPYFILGYLIRKSEWEPNMIICSTGFSLSVSLTAVGCFLLGKSYGLKNGLYFYSFLSVTVIPMAISTIFLLKKVTSPIINIQITRRTAALALGIYLVHPVIIDFLTFNGIYALKFNPLISVPVISFAVFIISAIIAWVIHMIPYVERII